MYQTPFHNIVPNKIYMYSDEDCTPIVNNEDFDGDEFITSCNCMDEGCPNSRSPPYDRIRMPYKRFFNEHTTAGRLDVVGAAVNER